MSQTTSEINLSILTLTCTTFSLVGSICVISSYIIAKTKTNPKAAQLILNLAVTDFFWFLASLLKFSFLVNISSPRVPNLLCISTRPIIVFTRQASLVWQCAISFDVYMSLNRRKWLWKGEESRWNAYRRTYVVLVLIFTCPAAIVAMVNQHAGDSILGCTPGYEKLGSATEVFFFEIFPIALCFFFNLFIFFMVRAQMSLKAFPQSVRKRRRRIQYYYIIACIGCWTPTIIFYLFELAEAEGEFMAGLETLSRLTLYLSGFVNFLIFGASDPHLRRSMLLIAYTVGLSRFIDTTAVVIQPSSSSSSIYENTNNIQQNDDTGVRSTISDADSSSHNRSIFNFPRAYSGALRSHSTEKIVMFGGVISDNADIAHDKYHCYNLLLSPEDKEQLYKSRPDLDSRFPIQRPKSILKKPKTRVTEISGEDALGSNSPRSSGSGSEYGDSNDSGSGSTANKKALSSTLPRTSDIDKSSKKSASFRSQPVTLEIDPLPIPSPLAQHRKLEPSKLILSELTMRVDSEDFSLLSDPTDVPKEDANGQSIVPNGGSSNSGGSNRGNVILPPSRSASPPVRQSSQASETGANWLLRPRRISDTAATFYSIVTGTRRNSGAEETNGQVADIEQPLMVGQSSDAVAADDSSSDEEDEEDRELKEPLKKSI